MLTKNILLEIKIFIQRYSVEIDNGKTDPDKKKSNKSFEIDIDTISDMMDRIEGLSYEGQRQIIAYLKDQVAKKEKELKMVE